MTELRRDIMCIEDMRQYIRDFSEYAEPAEIEEVYWLILEETRA